MPVVVSDKGRQAGAYGLYQGDTVARDNYHDRIIIFRDTLLRDFGHDPDLLRARSRARCATSWRTISAPTSSACARWGCRLVERVTADARFGRRSIA